MLRRVIILLLLLQTFALKALPPVLGYKDLRSHPPRVTRTCCAFGSEIKILGVPFFHLNPVIDITSIGTHEYLGGKNEGNGILYTEKGGFIDLGHLREWADWTAFLYLYIKENRLNGEVKKTLGVEGGMRKLTLLNINLLNEDDLLLLAGKIAFEMSLWHEIVTGYGISSAPFISEKFSSFSVEDMYSNLLGVELAKQAILSGEDYDIAFTKLLASKLNELGVAKNIDVTYAALENVESLWWSRSYSVPSRSVTIKRNYFEGDHIIPWLLFTSDTTKLERLRLVRCTSNGQYLDDYYDLNIKVSRKIPLKNIIPDHSRRIISENDFVAFSENVKFIFEENNGKNKVKRRRN